MDWKHDSHFEELAGSYLLTCKVKYSIGCFHRVIIKKLTLAECYYFSLLMSRQENKRKQMANNIPVSAIDQVYFC